MKRCSQPGCPNPHHSHGLCDFHVKAWRRAIAKEPDTDPRLLRHESRAERKRMVVVKQALRFGCVRDFEEWPFDSEDEHREAWELYGDHVMPEVPYIAGTRPQAWWTFVAERPDHLVDEPDSADYLVDRKMTDEGRTQYERDYIDWEHEPILWMAANGHLTDYELAQIEARAEEAEGRVGTEAEEVSSGFLHTDRAAVELARQVREAAA